MRIAMLRVLRGWALSAQGDSQGALIALSDRRVSRDKRASFANPVPRLAGRWVQARRPDHGGIVRPLLRHEQWKARKCARERPVSARLARCPASPRRSPD